jgi:N-ethylmaleimide reductase
MSKKIFSPVTVGDLQLKNRIVMAPMTRSRALENNAPNNLVATYYGQRAGAGLIITEGTSPSPNGVGYARIPGIFSEEQVKGWKLVADAVHAGGSKLFMQLMHTGRVSHILNMPEGAEVLAPSAIAAKGDMWTDQNGMQPLPVPRAMTTAEVKQTIQEHITAAKNAIKAGLDGVEVHGANGYLIEQFIHPGSNQRTDEYGGSIENRARFILEVTEGIVEAIGKDRVGVRLSPYGALNDMAIYAEIEQTYNYLAEKLNEIGVVYVHLVNHSSMGAPEVPASTVQSIRERFQKSLILSGGYDLERAEKDLQSGLANLIAFGRPFIANPDLVERLEKGAELAQADASTFYAGTAEGYTDYPTLK